MEGGGRGRAAIVVLSHRYYLSGIIIDIGNEKRDKRDDDAKGRRERMKVAAREGIGRFVRPLIVSISKDDESFFSSRLGSRKKISNSVCSSFFSLFFFFFLTRRRPNEFNSKSYIFSPSFFLFFSFSWKNKRTIFPSKSLPFF